MVTAYRLGILSTTSLTGVKTLYGMSLSSVSPYSPLYITGTGTEYVVTAGKTFVGYNLVVSNWQTGTRTFGIYYDDDGLGTNLTGVFNLYVPALCSIDVPIYFTIPSEKHIRGYSGTNTSLGTIVIGREE